jgi:hypothetical protein
LAWPKAHDVDDQNQQSRAWAFVPFFPSPSRSSSFFFLSLKISMKPASSTRAIELRLRA